MTPSIHHCYLWWGQVSPNPPLKTMQKSAFQPRNQSNENAQHHHRGRIEIRQFHGSINAPGYNWDLTPTHTAVATAGADSHLTHPSPRHCSRRSSSVPSAPQTHLLVFLTAKRVLRKKLFGQLLPCRPSGLSSTVCTPCTVPNCPHHRPQK